MSNTVNTPMDSTCEHEDLLVQSACSNCLASGCSGDSFFVCIVLMCVCNLVSQPPILAFLRDCTDTDRGRACETSVSAPACPCVCVCVCTSVLITSPTCRSQITRVSYKGKKFMLTVMKDEVGTCMCIELITLYWSIHMSTNTQW